MVPQEESSQPQEMDWEGPDSVSQAGEMSQSQREPKAMSEETIEIQGPNRVNTELTGMTSPKVQPEEKQRQETNSSQGLPGVRTNLPGVRKDDQGWSQEQLDRERMPPPPAPPKTRPEPRGTQIPRKKGWVTPDELEAAQKQDPLLGLIIDCLLYTSPSPRD